jgi:hypothetical protein
MGALLGYIAVSRLLEIEAFETRQTVLIAVLFGARFGALTFAIGRALPKDSSFGQLLSFMLSYCPVRDGSWDRK